MIGDLIVQIGKIVAIVSLYVLAYSLLLKIPLFNEHQTALGLLLGVCCFATIYRD